MTAPRVTGTTLAEDLCEASAVASATADFMASDVGGERPEAANKMRALSVRLDARARVVRERQAFFDSLLPDGQAVKAPQIKDWRHMYDRLTGPLPADPVPAPRCAAWCGTWRGDGVQQVFAGFCTDACERFGKPQHPGIPETKGT